MKEELRTEHICRSRRIARIYVAVSVILLVSLIPVTIAAQPLEYDVSVSEDATPGGTIHYYVDLHARKQLDVIVSITYYIPGIGWSDWSDVWEGKLYGDKTVIGKIKIPENAETGNIVIFVNVQYYGADTYTVEEGKRYYVGDTMVHVVKTMYGKDVLDLKKNYEDIKAKFEELREEYLGLKKEYENLETDYNGLVKDYNKLKDSYDTLREENVRLRETIAELRGDLKAAEQRAGMYLTICIGELIAILALLVVSAVIKVLSAKGKGKQA